jgi:hypothetical protein
MRLSGSRYETSKARFGGTAVINDPFQDLNKSSLLSTTRLQEYTKWRRSLSEQLTAVRDNAMYRRMKRLSPMWTEPCLREQRTLFGSRTYGLVAANSRDPHRRGGGVLTG